MEFVVLNNNVTMPKLGFGVFQIAKEDCERCVLDAIDVGYRHFDTAQSYFNEAELGSALQKSGLPREEFFITTKVWIDNFGYEKTKQSIARSLARLQTDYIDLVLLHQPFGDYYAAYHALEDLYKAKKIRAIGVSNFSAGRLADIAAFNEITPQVNQIEVNPLHQQKFAQDTMIERNVQMAAWAPFGEGHSGILQNEVLNKIAKAHNKTIAQVILRWLMQRNIVTLTKSTHKQRMQENFAIFDFTLSAQEMEQIAKLDTKSSVFFDYQSPQTVDLFVQLIEKRKGLC